VPGELGSKSPEESGAARNEMRVAHAPGLIEEFTGAILRAELVLAGGSEVVEIAAAHDSILGHLPGRRYGRFHG